MAAKEKIITIKPKGATPKQYSAFFVRVKFNEASLETIWCRLTS